MRPPVWRLPRRRRVVLQVLMPSAKSGVRLRTRQATTSRMLGQGDTHVSRTGFRIGAASIAGRDHDVLSASCHVSDGSGGAGERQRVLPEQCAGFGVKGADLVVMNGCTD